MEQSLIWDYHEAVEKVAKFMQFLPSVQILLLYLKSLKMSHCYEKIRLDFHFALLYWWSAQSGRGRDEIMFQCCPSQMFMQEHLSGKIGNTLECPLAFIRGGISVVIRLLQSGWYSNLSSVSSVQVCWIAFEKEFSYWAWRKNMLY